MSSDDDFLAEFRARKAARDSAESAETAVNSAAEGTATPPPECQPAEPQPEPEAVASEAAGRNTADTAPPPSSPGQVASDAGQRVADATSGIAAGVGTATGAPDVLRRLTGRIEGGDAAALPAALDAATRIAETAMAEAEHRAPVAIETAVHAAGDALAHPTAGQVVRACVRPSASGWERRHEAVIDALTTCCDAAVAIDPSARTGWQALARAHRERLAALSAALDAACAPGSAEHRRARARGAARARMEAMPADERRAAAREAQLRRVPPEQAAAARSAAKRQAAADEWKEAARRIAERYPALARVWADGPVPILHAMRAAGLGETTTTTRKNPDGSDTRVSREALPQVTALRETPRGLEVEIVPLRGQALSTWERAVGALRLHLGIETLAVEQQGRAVVLTTGDAALHLPKVHPLAEPRVVDPVTWRSYLGVSPEGEAYIEWEGISGAVIGGEPNSGKTGSLLPVLAGLAGEMELYVFNGKGTHDLEPLRTVSRTYDDSGDVEGPLLDTLTELEELRTLRDRAIHRSTGISNFWNVPLEKRTELCLHPIMVVIDECQEFFDTSGSPSKEVRQRRERIKALVRTLVQMGRSMGIIVTLTTQKPTSESIPTNIRDISRIRIALACSTRSVATAILGTVDPHADPTRIAPAMRGRAIIRGMDGTDRPVQSAFVHEHDVATYLRGVARVPDQRTVAEHLARG